MFSCKMKKGISDFKNVFDLYSQIGMVEACLDLKKTGMHIYTTYDKSVHAMTFFNHLTFQEYSCEKDRVFTLSIKSMKENLKNITSVDVIEMTIKKDLELKIKVIKKTIEFEKTIAMKESQIYELPLVLEQVAPLTIKSSDFLEFCRSINSKYDLWIKTTLNVPEIIFESEKTKVIVKSGVDDDGAAPTVKVASYTDKFKAEYFSKLKKIAKFDSGMRVYVNPNQPLILETCVGGGDLDRLTVWIKSLKQLDEDYEDAA